MHFPKCSLVLLIGFIPSSLFSQQLEPEYQTAFDWIDSLQPRDWHTKPLVMVQPKNMRNRHTSVSAIGFLLDTTDESFTVLSLDFKVKVEPRTRMFEGLGQIEQESINVAPAELAAEIRAGNLFAFDPFARPFMVDFDDIGIHPFFVARACAADGSIEEANQMCEWTRERLRKLLQLETGDLKTLLNDAIAMMKIKHLKDQLRSTDIDRNKLLATSKKIFQQFPSGRHHRELIEIIAVLQRMVREDQEYVRPEAASEEQQLQNWIYQLREQGESGTVVNKPLLYGFALRHLRAPYPKGSAAQELIDADLAAIPYLIEALDDRSFSRCIDDSASPHEIVRVRDWAVHLICEISGREFRRFTPDERGELRVDSTGVEERIRAWWTDIQQREEPKVLAAGVLAAREDSVSQAKRLVRKYPGLSVATIHNGVKNFENASDKSASRNIKVAPAEVGNLGGGDLRSVPLNHAPQLLRLTRQLPESKELNAMLREVVGSSFSIPTRLAAAEELLARGGPNITVEIVQLFQNGFQPRKSAEAFPLIQFLVNTELVSAINCIEANFSRLGPEDRQLAVELMGRKSENVGLNRRIDSLLVKLTRDRMRKLVNSSSGSELLDRRVCDLAGFYFQVRHGKSFNLSLDEHLRDEELRKIRIAYFAERGVDHLEKETFARDNKVLDNKSVDPIILRIHGSDQQDFEQALEELRNLGFASLPRLVADLEKGVITGKKREALQQLTIELANMAGASQLNLEVDTFPQVQEWFNQRKGKQIDGTGCLELAEIALQDLPEKFNSLQMTIRRDARLIGLQFSFLPWNNVLDMNEVALDLAKVSVANKQYGFFARIGSKKGSDFSPKLTRAIDKALCIGQDPGQPELDLSQEVLIHLQLFRN